MATTMLQTITAVPSSTHDYLPAVDPRAVEQALLIGDISQMSDEVRIAYYVATCRSLGLNPLTKPFQALKTDDGKVVLYPDKGCAEQLRKLHRVSVRVIERQVLDDLYIVTVRATTPDGREEESQGIVPIAKPKGTWEDYEYRGEKKRRFKAVLDQDGHEIMAPLSATERATAMMRCETKAKRRVTLAICGLGLPDTDVEGTGHPMALDLQTGHMHTEVQISPVPDFTRDVPGSEHAADATDALFGDGAGDVFRTPQDAPHLPREGMQEPQPSPGLTPDAPETIVGQPGGNESHVDASAWRDTLEAYKNDTRLSDGLRSQAKLALNPKSNTSDAKGLALASAVLDTINAQEP